MAKRVLLTTRDILVILLLMIIAQMIAGIDIVHHGINNQLYTLLKSDFLSPLIYLGLFLLGFKYLKRHLYHDNFSNISLHPQLKSSYWFYIILLNVLILLGTFFVGVHLARPTISHYLFTQNIISGIFNDLLAAPLVEEITFRGVILGQVAKRYNMTTGILVSSILFGLLHLLNGSLNFISSLQVLISGTLMGLFLSLVYAKEGTIWANYLVHATYNLIWDLLPVQTAVTKDWPIQLVFNSHNSLLTGGQYGADCSLPNTLAYLIMVIIVLYMIHTQKRFSSLHS